MNTLIILVSFVASLNLPARQGELGVVLAGEEIVVLQ